VGQMGFARAALIEASGDVYGTGARGKKSSARCASTSARIYNPS
jgi:hypothetical protein